MLSSLQSLAPRDSHALWYTSSNDHSNAAPSYQESVNHAFDHLAPPPPQNAVSHARRGQYYTAAHRSPLARLRADELYLERRKYNVQNYGSSWIKPPGIFKTLHQLREERRELEEHQEALRREQLAQELAEAEAGNELLQGEGAAVEMEELRDLDDDIPEAETTGLDLDAADSDMEEGEDGNHDVPRGVLSQRMPEDVYREALVRGDEALNFSPGPEGGSSVGENNQSQMLREEDLLHEHDRDLEDDMDMGMGMDADLDDDVPNAETGEYEHTDTEAELSSSEDEVEESMLMGHLQHRHSER
ncbi:MAG: hypothetical protein M1818_004016 [Claussenomyces sp. TS43310]|nr:MAG: hypothetical protein M1818_004016 [Claussenomyces sp. TS43310]